MRRRFFLAAAASVLSARALAQESLSKLEALSGDRFVSGDEEFQLADVIAPQLYSLKKETPAYFASARAALDRQLSGDIEIKDVAETSRWGVRIVSARRTGASETLQESLVAAGAVRVAPQSENHAIIERLLSLEEKARASRRGLWSVSDYRVFDAVNATGAIDGYNLIEGVVLRAVKTRSRFYLNFGEDYRMDFTATAANRLYKRWLKAGNDLAELEGWRVRVRGFIEEINGPSLDLNHPLQIERLTPVAS